MRSRRFVLPPTEAALLERINQGFPVEFWEQYRRLTQKRRAEALTPAERQSLIGLTDQIEAANVRRLEHLVELARLRGMPLPALMDQLGLSGPPDA